ncbi:MAG: hypothetical protein QM703_18650 [Gemmatales bacterium]
MMPSQQKEALSVLAEIWRSRQMFDWDNCSLTWVFSVKLIWIVALVISMMMNS